MLKNTVVKRRIKCLARIAIGRHRTITKYFRPFFVQGTDFAQGAAFARRCARSARSGARSARSGAQADTNRCPVGARFIASSFGARSKPIVKGQSPSNGLSSDQWQRRDGDHETLCSLAVLIKRRLIDSRAGGGLWPRPPQEEEEGEQLLVGPVSAAFVARDPSVGCFLDGAVLELRRRWSGIAMHLLLVVVVMEVVMVVVAA